MLSLFRKRPKDGSLSAASSSLSALSAPSSSPPQQPRPCALHPPPPPPTEALLLPHTSSSLADSPESSPPEEDRGAGEASQAGEDAENPTNPPTDTTDTTATATTATATPPTTTPATAGPALVDAKGRCLACRREQLAARRYRWKVIVGLIFPFALQALDVTIVASALPWIATDFGAVAQLNWIISAFNLTAAAFIPFWGQAADIFGRHAAIQAALVVMMVGSAICTGAPTSAFPVLLLGRGIQGLGCAGLNVVVRVILLDRVSLRENAKNWSIFSFTAGMSYGIGPVIGGALTNVSWRWCFAINLPIGAAALVLIHVVLRPELVGAQPAAAIDGSENTSLLNRLATIDAGGQVLFLFGFGLVILALTWAGATYRWATAAVLVPLLAGLLLVAAFFAYERHMVPPDGVLARRWPRQRAMLPWRLLTASDNSNKDMGLLFAINVAAGAAMYAVLYFCSLYFTMVKLYGPTYAGTQLLYYTPGLGVGVYLSMYLLNGRPRNTFAPLMLGSVVEAVGVGVLAWALWSRHLAAIICLMALTGAGTGLRLMPGSLHAVGLFPRHIATVVSVMAVAVPLGGTLALTVMAAVFNNTSGIASTSPLRSVATLKHLAPEELARVEQKARMGIVWAFVSITPIMLACVVCALFLGNVNITKDAKDQESRPARGQDGQDIQEPQPPRPHVVGDIYLATLLRK